MVRDGREKGRDATVDVRADARDDRGLLPSNGHFRHEALFYASDAEFVEQTTGFVRAGLDAAEAVLVLVIRERSDLIRSALGDDARDVLFADMAKVGRNPARIISLWRDHLCRRGDEPVRGIGEPIWPGRTAQELVEASHHEALLNRAFAGSPAWILCPYDTAALPPDVIETAERNHPVVRIGGSATESETYRDTFGLCDAPLPEAPADTEEVVFEESGLDGVRTLVARHGAGRGLGSGRVSDLVVAVNEVATNSVRHGGGRGTLRIWGDAATVVCEIRDAGRIEDPLVGRERPPADRQRGFGLWLVNQLCDLVQVRATAAGSVVRLRVCAH